ncbi:MAG TPA: hypothetical protein VI298_08645 [Geobacteraceae bacterium]
MDNGKDAIERGTGTEGQRAVDSLVIPDSLYPAKCPITRRDFFMLIEHPEFGLVPTYGGPFDSYTIPEMDGEPDQPFHERGLFVYRFDHDLGDWVDGTESIPLRIIHEDNIPEKCESCSGLLGDDAPLYEDADICQKCHKELLQAEEELLG